MTAVQDWGTIGPGSSDAELARAAAAGDRQAFAGIYDRYADRLYDFCVGMLADRDAAADCVQDAFCEAATCLRDLREPDKLRPWLYGITRHRCLRRIRDRRREQPTDALPELVSADAGPDIVASRTELANLIAEAAGGLSDRDRAVLELSYRHGLDGPELAEALAVSQTNANTMVYRLRETMERCLGALLVCRRAHSNPSGCPELATILQGWDGHFTILMRKRIARHIDACPACEDERRGMLNPVALLGGAPMFVPAPAWLRDRTLNSFQLTSSGSELPPAADAPHPQSLAAAATVRLAVPGPRDPIWTEDAPAAHDRDRRSRRMLLLALLIGVPLLVLGVTIGWLNTPQPLVGPSGVTETAPASTERAPAIVTRRAPTPSETAQPTDAVPAFTPPPVQPSAPASAVESAAPATAPSAPAQRPVSGQPRSATPIPAQQPTAPEPEPILEAPPPEPDAVDPGPAELPQPAEAPAPEPEEPPVPIQDQIVIQPRHGDQDPDVETTYPYPR